MSESKEQQPRKPTRRPWEIYDFDGQVKHYPKTIIVAPTGESICEISGGWPQCTIAENEANAALIVRAVNSHEDSRRAIAYLVLNDCVKGAYWPEEIVAWAQTLMKGEARVGVEIVRSALALAEKQS